MSISQMLTLDRGPRKNWGPRPGAHAGKPGHKGQATRTGAPW